LVVFSPKWVHEQMAMQIWHSVQSERLNFSIFEFLAVPMNWELLVIYY